MTPYETCIRQHSRTCTCGLDNHRMAKQKRGYSDEFSTTGKTTRYLIDYIPAGLWRAVRSKAKREGVSLRTLILRLLQRWLDEA